MRVALDATYSVDSQPSGIAVYSNHLLSGLAAAYPAHRFLHCYRPKQFRLAPRPAYTNVSRALLLPPLPLPRAEVFHALNQRVDRRPAARVVSTFHDLFVLTGEYSSSDFRKRFAAQAFAAARHSDLIIAVSEFTATQITSLLGIERSRIRVIPHAVSPPRFPPAAQRDRMILFVGALQKRKNLIRLIEAFATVDASWRLVLAGAPTGYQAAEVLEAVRDSPARSRIEVTGYLANDRLQMLLAAASIFAFPSLDEGFGIPVLEAMAWGVPVLTSNGSALAELGQNAALLVDPLSAEQIADGLSRLITDSALRAQLASSGRQRVKEFTWENSVRKTFEVYSELL